MPVKETDDPTLEKGKRVTDEFGAPPRETSVHRLVYDANGKLLYDNTWRSFYVGEPTLVRVGTKAPPKKKVAKKKPAEARLRARRHRPRLDDAGNARRRGPGNDDAGARDYACDDDAARP